MSQPTPFDRQTSFALQSAENPGEPHSGTDLDGEFNAVKLTLDETLANLALIQDDDGALARGSVGRAQLGPSIALGMDAPTAWEPDTEYDADASTVFRAQKLYICITSHTSGASFDAAKWAELEDFSSFVIEDESIDLDAKAQDGSLTTAKIAPLAVTETRLAANSVSSAKLQDSSVSLEKLAVGVPSALADLIIPVGLGPLPYSLPDAPSGWIFCYGQAITNAYPALRAALIAAGNPFGTSGSDPKCIDMRGRMVVGLDDMGGVAANRVTTAGSGIDGVDMGAVGGAQNITLTTTHLPASGLTVTVTNPTHTHDVKHTQSTTGNFNPTGGSATYVISITSAGATTGTDAAAAKAQDTSATTSNMGTGGPHDNMPPSIVAPYIIKAH